MAPLKFSPVVAKKEASIFSFTHPSGGADQFSHLSLRISSCTEPFGFHLVSAGAFPFASFFYICHYSKTLILETSADKFHHL
jgi:hypothetical protein